MLYPTLFNHFAISGEVKKKLKSIDDRDKEKDLPNKLFKTYEFNLSHSRAIAKISHRSNKQYFQGSSLNRKKTVKPKFEEIEKTAETLDQSFFENKKVHHQLLRNVTNAHKRYENYGKEHIMSRRTKIKIKEKMLAVYAASKNNFTLCTLTMINNCPDIKAVKILNKFLTATKKQIGNYNYVWVAERQDNGRIHFHMIVDKRLDIDYINSLWVVQQYNAGIEHDTAHLRLSIDTGLTFKQLHKKGPEGYKLMHKYLNPVDVQKVQTINGVSAYLTNYVIKNDTKMGCAIWHCNRNVSKLFTKQLISKKVFDFTCNKKINFVKNKKGRIYENKTFVHQYGMINSIYNKKYFNSFLKEMNLLNSWILETDYNDKNNKQKIYSGILMDYDRYQQILYSCDAETGELKTASLKDYKTSLEAAKEIQEKNPNVIIEKKFIKNQFIYFTTNNN